MVKARVMAWGVVLGLLLLAGCAALIGSDAPRGEQRTARWTAPFTLGEGDVISVFVWKHPGLSKQVPVRPDGKISYPLIGEIEAAGLTVKQIEETIIRELKRNIRDPQVTVTLQKAHSFRIYVLGEVVRPGVFELKGPVTVVQAIAMAGGFTPFASRGKIIIFNPSVNRGQHRLFNYRSFINRKEIDQNIVLRPGDTVLVP